MAEAMLSNARSLFQDIINEGYQWIDAAIGQKEEGLYLDFKINSRPDILGVSADDKKNYGKMISAFANSSGGVIVWGIIAKKLIPDTPDVAQEEKPIKGVKKFLTDLNNLTSNATDPIVQGIENELIKKPEQNDAGFIVTFVPESEYAPHRSLADQNYYFRTGDSSPIMPHHLLALYFGQKRHPILKIRVRFERSIDMSFNLFSPSIIIGIENVGRYVALHPTLFIKLHPNWNIDYITGLCWPLEKVAQHHTTEFINGERFSGDQIIYPNTALDVCILVPSQSKLNMTRPSKNDDNFLAFSYSIFAQDADMVKDSFIMNVDDFYSQYGL